MQKTIGMPEHLVKQIEQLAMINRRSFSGQVVLMLEQMIDQSVERDLQLIQAMRSGSSGT